MISFSTPLEQVHEVLGRLNVGCQLLVFEGDHFGDSGPGSGFKVLEESLLHVGSAELGGLVRGAGNPQTVDLQKRFFLLLLF